MNLARDARTKRAIPTYPQRGNDMPADYKLKRIDADSSDLFFKLHNAVDDCGGCYCMAWWVRTWAEWETTDADSNAQRRRDLFARGESDGYLLLENDAPIAWCQVGPRDRLAKLVEQYHLDPDPSAWAITCFAVLRERRREGHADRMLKMVLEDVARRNVCDAIEAFPVAGEVDSPLDLWTGPLELFQKNGFSTIREDPTRPILSRSMPKVEA